MQSDIIEHTKSRLQKILDVIKQDIATIRTGKATPALVENIIISAYGGTAKMRLMELATIGATDPQTLIITPFDKSIIHEIEKGVQDAHTGLNPIVDGQLLRISLPPLSEERRQELIKAMHHKLENGKIMVRQARHESMEEIKKQHNDSAIDDDEKVRLEKEVQRIIDDFTSLIDAMGKQKEEELLQL